MLTRGGPISLSPAHLKPISRHSEDGLDTERTLFEHGQPRASPRHWPFEQALPSVLDLIESVHLCAVPDQVAGLREGLAAGGAGEGTVTGMDSHVCRQIVGLREGLAAGGAGGIFRLTSGCGS